MNTFGRSRLSEIVEDFSKSTILVLGDLMLDRYLWGQVNRISPEAPVPVVAVNRETSCLGGAGNGNDRAHRVFHAHVTYSCGGMDSDPPSGRVAR